MASRRGKLGKAALMIVGGGVSISLLFWAKLRVVTNIPRTTYAAPDERAEAEQDERETAGVEDRQIGMPEVR